MAILNAYFDESGKHKDHPVVAFCGVVASPDKVQRFDVAWKQLLTIYGLKSLHMKDASDANKHLSDKLPIQTLTQRIDALKPFADCINGLDLGIIEALDVNGFNALSPIARARIGNPDDPYYMSFARGILELAEKVSSEDRISLICDEDPETARTCYAHYEAVKVADDKVKEKILSLTFADDEHFPCLQAADMVAYLARREARFRFYNKPDDFQDLFNYLVSDRGPDNMKWISLFADEKMLKHLSAVLSTQRAPVE
jgi:hypothetical protein